MKIYESGMKMNIKNLFIRYHYLIILFIIIVVSSLLSPYFLHPRNITSILRVMSIMSIITCGTTIIIITGMVDLSCESGGIFAGTIALIVYTATNSVRLAILIGILSGSMAGLLSGFLIARFGLPSFIITLAMMTSLRGITFLCTSGYPILNADDLYNFMRLSFLGIPVQVVFMFITFFIMFILLKKTRFGRSIYAAGDNETKAAALGVNIKRMKIIVFIIAGALTGFAGVNYCTIILNRGAVAPTYTPINVFYTISAVLLGGGRLKGGRGSLTGTLAGCLILSILANILNLTNVSPYLQQILKAVMLISILILNFMVDKLTPKLNIDNSI